MADEPALFWSDQTNAAALGISRATWWRRVEDGTLPRPIKFGGVTRWKRDDVLAAIERASAEQEVA